MLMDLLTHGKRKEARHATFTYASSAAPPCKTLRVRGWGSNPHASTTYADGGSEGGLLMFLLTPRQALLSTAGGCVTCGGILRGR